ncbi:MAG: DUF3006 domain-containing protein [Paenisporosarcina sp.]
MISNKYSVDRIDDGYVVLLKRPFEVDQLLIPIEEINFEVSEGDIVLVASSEDGNDYIITLLDNETAQARDNVDYLIEKLKNK